MGKSPLPRNHYRIGVEFEIKPLISWMLAKTYWHKIKSMAFKSVGVRSITQPAT
jgi:hypothetical protein